MEVAQVVQASKTQAKAAAKMDISTGALSQRLADLKAKLPLIEDFRRNHANLLDHLQLLLLCSIEPEELKKMSVRDRVLCLGIAHDKSRLASGDDVIKLDIRLLHGDLEEIQRKKQELQAKLVSIANANRIDQDNVECP